MQDERRAAGDVQDHDIVAGNGAHANPVQAAAAPGVAAHRLLDPPAGSAAGSATGAAPRVAPADVPACSRPVTMKVMGWPVEEGSMASALPDEDVDHPPMPDPSHPGSPEAVPAA